MSDLSDHLNDTERKILRQALGLLLAMREHIDAEDRPQEFQIHDLAARVEKPAGQPRGGVRAMQTSTAEDGGRVSNYFEGTAHGPVLQAGRDVHGGVRLGSRGQ